jgi:hypothetical protein
MMMRLQISRSAASVASCWPGNNRAARPDSTPVWSSCVGVEKLGFEEVCSCSREFRCVLLFFWLVVTRLRSLVPVSC